MLVAVVSPEHWVTPLSMRDTPVAPCVKRKQPGLTQFSDQGIGAPLIGGAMSEHAFVREELRRQQLPGADARGDKAERSVRVVSAVELVEQSAQRDETNREANDHKPPSIDGSQHDRHEGKCEK